MKTASPYDRSALVTHDNIFHSADTKKLIEATGVKLEIIKGMGALWDDLSKHIIPKLIAAFRHEMGQIQEDLNNDKEELTKQIAGFINASDLRTTHWQRAKELNAFSVTDFSMIKIDLPENRPPYSEYHRVEGERVRISAVAKTQVDAIVEKFNWLTSLYGGQAPDPDAQPTLEEQTLVELFNVSLLGTVKNGKVGDFEVTAVEAYKT
jgi:hypothetical protein